MTQLFCLSIAHLIYPTSAPAQHSTRLVLRLHMYIPYTGLSQIFYLNCCCCRGRRRDSSTDFSEDNIMITLKYVRYTNVYKRIHLKINW